ncbi:uncharacterized protein LOC116849512 isoform X2 [Odontomachus brunneus]|uniref:uncharacterized protein LOC116849512 isoform X2 n=1 Tax=Odontomachus brunneus TaxID=486640 RepID=UPI0013F291FE|nr:uncharacterized protein LOC116849512 isoform X2 [Odontomachus brunneus]
MNRTKSRNGKAAKATKTASSIKNSATQTVDSNILTEITKLQKQVECLQLENDFLKKQISASARTNNPVDVLPLNKTQEMPKFNIKASVCGCKGDCSSKRCRCMKESNKCTALCRCSNEICQNQEIKDQDEESDTTDKENISNMATPKKELTQNKVSIKTKDNLISDKIICGTEMHKEQFDPMKPRHQLSRTPPRKNESVDEKIHVDNRNLLKPQLPPSPQIIASSFNMKENQDLEDFSSMEKVVDWMQHTAQLIPCKKCKRTFMPHRIQKHEACCKKI